MERDGLPLLLASTRFAAGDESQPLDRVRMQKGVFLLQMRGSEAWRGLFDFEPYDWGPYSRQLSSSVSHLLVDGMLEQDQQTSSGYSAYRTTPAGERAVSDLEGQLSPSELEFIRAVRRFVTTRSFNQLLRDVYAAHPEYATASRFGR